MLSTECPSSPMGRTHLPRASLLARPTRASCLVSHPRLMPHAVCCSRLAPPAPRALHYAPPHLAPPVRTRAMHSRGPTSALWHRAPCQRQAPRQRASIGGSKKMSTCCNRVFHAFQMYVVYVLSGCCKNRSGVAYVAMTIHVCCKYMFLMFQPFQMMLQVFYLDITYVALAIHVYCKCIF